MAGDMKAVRWGVLSTAAIARLVLPATAGCGSVDFRLRGDGSDAYPLEFEAVSAAIADGVPLEFGPGDAVEQARVLDAVRRSVEGAEAVEPAGATPPGPPTGVAAG
jgi:hypothetical protein